MATIETIDFGEFGKMQAANISTVVGEGEANDRNDVLLIQTLFRLIGVNEVFSQGLIGLLPSELPSVSGICDRLTLRAIWKFQRRVHHRLVNVDGKIHPGKYQNRVIKDGSSVRHMMITMLNKYAAQINEGLDLITSIRKMTPQIAFQQIPTPPKVK
jgi:hypothetical protein